MAAQLASPAGACLRRLDEMMLMLEASSLDLVGVVAVAVGVAGVSMVDTVALRDSLVLLHDILLVVVVDVDTETSWVDVLVAKDEKSTENWLGEQIKDTVEDGLAVGRDDIATLAETPGDWVQEPKDRGEGTAKEENLANVRTKGGGVTTSLPDKDPENVEKCNATKDKVSPLVRRLDESTNETSDNHNLVN